MQQEVETGENGAAVSGAHVWLSVWKTYESLRNYAERHIGALGLGLSDFAILELLLHKGPMPVNCLGEVIRLTSGSLTSAVDRLEEKDLVKRKSCADDRRTRMVHLTSGGRRLITAAFADHEVAMEKAASGLSGEERAALTALLEKLEKQARGL